jgi:hypothetical protein
MTLSAKSDVKNDDLICPITLQVFCDPVVATDGRTYERAAIVRWITEHGTSPFTRQSLNINELQTDDYLKNLAAQRRSSTTSYDYDRNLDHVVLSLQSLTIPCNYNINVDEAVLMQTQNMPNNRIASISVVENSYESFNDFCHGHGCVILYMIIAVLTVALLTFGFDYVTGKPVHYGEFFMST